MYACFVSFGDGLYSGTMADPKVKRDTLVVGKRGGS